MKLVKYEVRGTIIDITDDPLPNLHHTFGVHVALDPEDALLAAIKRARRVETIGQRVEDIMVANVRIVKITEEEVAV